MSKSWSRREVLKSMGISFGASLIPLSILARDENGRPLTLPEPFRLNVPGKPITAITLGAGNRGTVYGNFALAYPQHLDVVGVAEPIPSRNERYAKAHQIPDTNRFKTWEDVFKKPKFADAIIISTPDRLHYGPCMAALKMGYHVLLEKPISPSEQECRDILSLTKETGLVVAVCHVLRYSPYFVKLRELMQSGKLGDIISVQHLEPIEHVHMSHSYVRGNWHNSKTTTPIILAKSCHDMDILRWLIDKPSKTVTAFGNLKWFTKEQDPEGSTERCMDGCVIERTCPFSAMRIYYRDRKRLYVFELPEEKDKQGEAILNYLRTTDYGRCVYKMDNDQCDHYVANILFENGITAAFSMEAFTSYEGRRTRVMGSMGDVVGDMQQFVSTDFRTGEKNSWELRTDSHGGGDWRLTANWVQAVDQKNPDLLTSKIDVSIESHVMCFAAEKSRLEGTKVDVMM